MGRWFIASACSFLCLLFFPTKDSGSIALIQAAFADGGGFERGVDGAATSSRTTRAKTRRTTRKTGTSKKTTGKKQTASQARLRRFPAITATVPDFRDRQILIVFASDTPDQAIDAVGAQFGLQRIDDATIALIDRRVVKFSRPAQFPPGLAIQISADPRVDAVQPNYLYGLAAGPVPQYAFDKLAIPQAHGIAQGKNVLVAVIDTGIDRKHPALAGAIAGEFNALGKRKGVYDGHGTAVSSIIASRGGVMVGVAPAASILSVQAFARPKKNRPTVGETFDLLRGIDWSAENGARVLNLSFAGPHDPLLRDTVGAAVSNGIVAVAAAGNRGPKAPPAYPAAYPDVLAVSATDVKDRIYKHSNRGEHIAVAAPGVDVVAAGRYRKFGLMSGTSFAAAYVSGSIALMLEGSPEMSATSIADRITSAARDLGPAGHDVAFGHGLIDTYKALNGGSQ